MSSAFQERFKGKTAMMTKEGVDGVIKDSDNPIKKINERPLIQMEDFTGQHRYSGQKREAQTFDMNRPFFSPDRAQNPNIYSATYSKPNKSVDQYLLVHNQQPYQQFNSGIQAGLPPRYPPAVNRVNNGNNNNGMSEMDSIDQQMEQIKQSHQLQYQQQQQFQIAQASRQGGFNQNSNNVTPNQKIPQMKQTFQTDNGIPYYNPNGYYQQAVSLDSIQKINTLVSNKKPSSQNHAPVSANLNHRSSQNQQQQQQQGIHFLKGLNSAQSSNSTNSSALQKNFQYQNESLEQKQLNGNQYNNGIGGGNGKNGYNLLYNNVNNSLQKSSKEVLMPSTVQQQQDFLPQAMSVQQQPSYNYSHQNNLYPNNNNNIQYNNNNNNTNNSKQPNSFIKSSQQQQQQYQNQFDAPDLNSRAYSAKFKIKTQKSGSTQEIDNQYEEAPFLKNKMESANDGVKRVRNNKSRETTSNKSINEIPSSMNSLNNYKPYTLDEYKSIQKNTNYKLGGLGPNIGNQEWQMKREQQEKRQEFAKQIQSINTQVLKNQQDSGKVATIKCNKVVSSREKALEFAKNIPKVQQQQQQQYVNQNSKQNSQSTNALGTNNTLPQSQTPTSTLKDYQNKQQPNIYDNNDNNKQFMNNSNNNSNNRNAYSSLNNYNSGYKRDDPQEQENQPDMVGMQLNSDIDFHEQQHLEFLNQIEKITK